MSPISRRALLADGLALVAGGVAAEFATPYWESRAELWAAEPSVPEITTDEVVFLVPHQDDDVISMGFAIARAVREGRQVYVLEVTDGAVTNALGGINQKIHDFDSSHGTSVGALDPVTLSQARTREQLSALGALGVPASHVFQESVPGRPETPGHPYVVTDETHYRKFVEVVNAYVDKFPKATICTMSWLDMHPDHYHLGYALDEATRRRNLPATRFFQSPLYQPAATGPQLQVRLPYYYPKQVTTIPRVHTPRGGYLHDERDMASFAAATQEYRRWDPPQGRFAVARYSVYSQLAYAEQARRSWIHRDSRYWASPALRDAAAYWVRYFQKPNLKLE